MITLEMPTGPTDEVRTLIGELETDLAQGYAPEQRHAVSLEVLFRPPIRFFVARLDGEVVGCGGVALFPDFAEVKRMYVCAKARGGGVAQAILLRLEKEARTAGLEWLRLETGNVQMAAMKMYQRAGFVQCAAFGAYLELDARAVETSVFYEKRVE